MSEFDSIEEELKFMADCSDDRGDSETSLMFVRYLAHIRKLNAELAALKAGQGEAVACLVRSRHMSTPARLAHDGKDHFTPWGEWEPGTLAYGEAVTDAGRNTPCLYEMRPLYTAPPASADAVSVPVELLHAAARLLKSYQEVIDNCHSSELERFDYQPEVQGAADELRAMLARQEVKS